jgi:hypothetical protein
MSTSYTWVLKYVETHITVKSSKVSSRKTLQWVHIAITNFKRTLLGVCHRINQKYLQLYLDVFCHKLNRRYFKDKLFDRLVIVELEIRGVFDGEHNLLYVFLQDYYIYGRCLSTDDLNKFIVRHIIL